MWKINTLFRDTVIQEAIEKNTLVGGHIIISGPVEYRAVMQQNPAPQPAKKEEGGDLMALVSTGKQVEEGKLAAAIIRAERLEKLGFTAVATPLLAKTKLLDKAQGLLGEKLTAITEEKILAFLNKINGGSSHKEKQDGYSLCMMYQKYNGSWIVTYRATWNEVVVADYPGIPPESALARFEAVKEKGAFDFYTIASVTKQVTKIPDPLLLGRFNGSDDRYFLAQWGDDVSLDDVI